MSNYNTIRMCYINHKKLLNFFKSDREISSYQICYQQSTLIDDDIGNTLNNFIKKQGIIDIIEMKLIMY